MAVTYAVLLDSLSTANFGTGAHTTASFTPTAGRRLVAVTGGQENNGTTDPAPSFTIADSQGLTWTKVGDVGNPASWSHGMAVWVSTPVAASATTVTFDCGTRSIWRYFYSVFEVAGSAGVTAGYVEATAAATDGAYSKTLSAAPTTNDLSVFARILDTATTGLSMGAGWTVIGNQSDASSGGSMAVAVRTVSSSATVSISDTNTAGTTTAKASDFAFTITASSGVTGTAAAPLGGLTATAAASSAVAAAPLGGLTAAATRLTTVTAVAAAPLGGLVATADATASTTAGGIIGATALAVGSTPVTAVYFGTTKVWPPQTVTTTPAATRPVVVSRHMHPSRRRDNTRLVIAAPVEV